MRDVLTSDGVFLVVQGKNNLSHLVEVLDWGVHGENTVPDEEHKVQEGPELDCPAVACALGVFAGPEAEVEAQLDKVGNVVGLGDVGVGSYGHNGVNDSQGDRFFLPEWEILNPVGIELLDEVLVKTGVSL